MFIWYGTHHGVICTGKKAEWSKEKNMKMHYSSITMLVEMEEISQHAAWNGFVRTKTNCDFLWSYHYDGFHQEVQAFEFC